MRKPESISVAELKQLRRGGKIATPRKRSPVEEELEQQIAYRGMPKPETEFRFLKDRRFRLDFAWPAVKLAVDVEGAVFVQGRHTRGAGYTADLKRSNLLTINGWRHLRFTPAEVNDGSAVLLIEQALTAPTGAKGEE